MIIPEACLEADHCGRRMTWGVIATRWLEYFVSVRWGSRRYMLVWCPSLRYVRTAIWPTQ